MTSSAGVCSVTSAVSRYADFSELGIELPQLPYNLHPVAGQRKFPKQQEEEGEVEEVEAGEAVATSVRQHPVQLHPFGRVNEDINAVVIEAALEEERLVVLPDRGEAEPAEYPDYSDVVIVGEEDRDSLNTEAVGALAGPPARAQPPQPLQLRPQTYPAQVTGAGSWAGEHVLSHS